MTNNKQGIDSTIIAAHVKSLRNDGYTILENVFDKTKIQALYDYLNHYYIDFYQEDSQSDRLMVDSKRFMISVDVSHVFNDQALYANPLILAIMQEMLEKQFIINNMNCVVSLPGAKDSHMHRDGTTYGKTPLSPMLPAHSLSVFIPLVSINEQNGPTRVWPGSHRSKREKESYVDDPNFINVALDAGSAFLMDYRLFHLGCANQSKAIRPLFLINYSNAWYIDSANLQKTACFTLDDENLQKIPPQYRPLFIRRNIDFSKTTKFC